MMPFNRITLVILLLIHPSSPFTLISTLPPVPLSQSQLTSSFSSSSSHRATIRPLHSAASQIITPSFPSSTSTSNITKPVVEFEFNDTLQKFSASCKSVFGLRKGRDLSLPPNMISTGVRDYQHLWTNETWEIHINRMRYFRHLFGLPNSRILRRILPVLSILMAWTVGIWHVNADHRATLGHAWYVVPLTPITLLASFVAFLLTLRTNQSLARLMEGRLAWGRTVLLARDTSQLLAAYIYPVNKQHGILAARHLSLFGWLLKSRLRDEEDSDIVNVMLRGPSHTDAKFVNSSRKRPVALIARIRQIVSNESNKKTITTAAHHSLESNLLELNRVYGMCERLRGSPVPPMYTRHTSRLLMFWLFSLPLALTDMALPVSIITSFMAGFITLGLDEISHQIEQPFRLMPMQPLARAVMMDVADAFACMPPRLPICNEEFCIDSSSETEIFERPEYW